jgi:BirA family biotin operon repressor/biotin-[acetyl-CoA-carboxylase] ligase
MQETLFIGKNVIHQPVIPSTNDYAKQLLAEKKQIEGTLIYCDEQTGGKGQMGASWESERKKNLTASYILYPNFLSPDKQFFLNIAISLAVREFCESLTEHFVQIKWPNDILIESKKVSGILIETAIQSNSLQHAIIGIGVNINQLNFPEHLPNATSILANNPLHTEPFEISRLLKNLSFFIEKYYLQLKQEHYHFLSKAYITSLWRYNQTHEFLKGKQILKGEITGLAKDGKLEIDINGKTQRFGFKEVEYIL